MKIFFLISFFIFSSGVGLAQKHHDHGNLPDYICNQSDIRFVSANGVNKMSCQLQLKKITNGEITIQTSVEAFSDTAFELGHDEYLLLSEIVSCPENKRRDYKFTFYDPKVKKQWTFYIQEHEEPRALYKYRKLVQEKVDSRQNEPEIRSGSEDIDSKLQILLKGEKRDETDKKLYLYYSQEELEKDSSNYVGEFIEYFNVKTLVYKDNLGREKSIDPNEIYGFKLDNKLFYVVKDHNMIVTPIGYREKFFYLNATTTLNIISTSKEAFKLGFGNNPTRLHFVSDTQGGEIYKLHDLKKNYSGGLNVIFECVDELETKNLELLIYKELNCVQQFLSEDI